LSLPLFAATRSSVPPSSGKRGAAIFTNTAGLIEAMSREPETLNLSSLEAAKLALDADEALREAPGDYSLEVDRLPGTVRLLRRVDDPSAPALAIELQVVGPKRLRFDSTDHEIDVRGLARALEQADSLEASRVYLDRLYAERRAEEPAALALRIERTLSLGRFDLAIPMLHRYRELPAWAHDHHLRPVLREHLPEIRRIYASAYGRVPLKVQVKMSREKDFLEILLDNVLGENRASVFYNWPAAERETSAATEAAPSRNRRSGTAGEENNLPADFAWSRRAEIERFIIGLSEQKKESHAGEMFAFWAKESLPLSGILAASIAGLAALLAAETSGWIWIPFVAASLYAFLRIAQRFRRRSAVKWAEIAIRHGWVPKAEEPPAALARPLAQKPGSRYSGWRQAFENRSFDSHKPFHERLDQAVALAWQSGLSDDDKVLFLRYLRQEPWDAYVRDKHLAHVWTLLLSPAGDVAHEAALTLSASSLSHAVYALESRQAEADKLLAALAHLQPHFAARVGRDYQERLASSKER